jgi:hypothetical protein
MISDKEEKSWLKRSYHTRRCPCHDMELILEGSTFNTLVAFPLRMEHNRKLLSYTNVCNDIRTYTIDIHVRVSLT